MPNDNERTNISLVGKENELFLEFRERMDSGFSNPKLIGICLKNALEHRSLILYAWTEIMVGTTNAMEKLGADENTIKVIQWCNLLLQQVLTNNVPPRMALQMTSVANDWIKQRKEEMVLEYEESLRESMG